MRTTLAIPYAGGLSVALFVAQTQLDGDARIAAMGAVLLAMALLFKWQMQRMLRADREQLRRMMTCDGCGYSRDEHWRDHCPGGDPDNMFTRDHFGLAR